MFKISTLGIADSFIARWNFGDAPFRSYFEEPPWIRDQFTEGCRTTVFFGIMPRILCQFSDDSNSFFNIVRIIIKSYTNAHHTRHYGDVPLTGQIGIMSNLWRRHIQQAMHIGVCTEAAVSNTDARFTRQRPDRLQR